MAVPPLLYHQVRMLAEAALGAPQPGPNTFWFDPSSANGPVYVEPGSPPPADGVVVPTTNRTTVVPLTSVLLEPFGLPQGVGVNAVTLQADAAFWSDSAVQKFVLPYYASVMGYEASVRLAQLQAAWSGQVPGVNVYALLHVTATPAQPGGPPVPVEPLWVVYLENPGGPTPTLGALSLADFLARYSPPPAPALGLPQPRPYDPPAPPAPGAALPGYGALRAMAEWSAAIDTPDFMYFTWDPAQGPQGQFGNPSDGFTSGQIVIPVQNADVNARPTMVREVTLATAGQPPIGIFEAMSYYRGVTGPLARYYRPDSFFWSTGAIEQFMLPYYASVDGFDGLVDLQAIQTAWNTSIQGTGGPAGATVTLGGEVTLLGLVHIPRSIWVTDESAASQETFVVHVGTDGTPRVTSLRDFLTGRGG